jgi:hypothetical protein
MNQDPVELKAPALWRIEGRSRRQLRRSSGNLAREYLTIISFLTDAAFAAREGEMNNQNRLLIAAAVCACFALAFPVLASAAVWKHKGVNVTKFVELSLSGSEHIDTEINGEASGVSCPVKATMTTDGGSTAKITKYELKSCVVYYGEMTKCEVVSQEAKGLPWTVDVNASDLTITNMRVKRTFKYRLVKGECPVTELDKTFSSLTVSLLDPSAISAMEFKGSLTNYTAYGHLQVEGANDGTYGIG